MERHEQATNEAFNQWLRKKKTEKELIKKKLRDSKKDTEEDKDEKAIRAKEAFDGWLRRKAQSGSFQKQKKSQENNNIRNQQGYQHYSSSQSPGELAFENWLMKKKREKESDVSQVVAQKKQLREEQKKQELHRKEETNRIYQNWLKKKQADINRQRKADLEAQSKIIKEAQMITSHPSEIVQSALESWKERKEREESKPEETWRPSTPNSARIASARRRLQSRSGFSLRPGSAVSSRSSLYKSHRNLKRRPLSAPALMDIDVYNDIGDHHIDALPDVRVRDAPTKMTSWGIPPLSPGRKTYKTNKNEFIEIIVD
eukprot:m.4223 g.4223  ORF g.4223 m.4223 type:complete len:315 (-) comp2934_c0_seq1:12-956(-)